VAIVTFRRLPSATAQPFGIAVAADGTVWFTENRRGGFRVGRLQ
jgi:streptogramin lyase